VDQGSQNTPPHFGAKIKSQGRKATTDAVHVAGSYLALPLGALACVANPTLLRQHGLEPVSSSVVRLDDEPDYRGFDRG